MGLGKTRWPKFEQPLDFSISTGLNIAGNRKLVSPYVKVNRESMHRLTLEYRHIGLNRKIPTYTLNFLLIRKFSVKQPFLSLSFGFQNQIISVLIFSAVKTFPKIPFSSIIWDL